jgi:hypothetical protein
MFVGGEIMESRKIFFHIILVIADILKGTLNGNLALVYNQIIAVT